MSSDRSHESLLQAGIRCIERKDFRSARKSLGQAVRIDPHNVRSQYWLGVALYHLGRCREAKDHLNWVRKHSEHPIPERPAAVFEFLARCCISSDTDEAIRLAQAGLEKDPNDARLRFVAGSALARQRRRDEAWHHYKMAYRLEGGVDGKPAFPDHPGLIPYSLSGILVEMKRWKEALEAVDEAIRREPNSAIHHNRRAVILFEGLGKTNKAIDAVAKAIQLDPGTQSTGFDGVFHFNHALFLRAAGRIPEALIAIDNAINLSPQQAYKALRNELRMEAGPNELHSTIVVERAEPSHTESQPGVSPSPPPPALQQGGPDSHLDFSKVGGMGALKEQVRKIMAVIHTNREEARRYGIKRNGMLLHGPPGCGKTFFAKAMAGEFGLNFINVPLGSAQSMYVGGAGQAMASVFQQARNATPCLLFFDEFDAVAAKRKNAGTQLESQMVNALLQQIDAHRDTPGIILAAATNRLEEIDPAVIREGRFDYKVKIPKPDFDARREILQVLLRDRPHDPTVEITELAQQMEGFTAAQVRNVVDEAAMDAWEADAQIGEGHLWEAYQRHVTAKKFGGKQLTWDDLVLPSETKQRLQFIENYIEHPKLAKKLGVELPTGLLLFGPPGTGKTTIARVLASQTDASFFSINASDIFTKWFGESEQKVKDLFERARDSVPAILFIDEADAVLSHRAQAAGDGQTARNSIINTFLAEMDGMEENGRLFVVAATNRPELIDDAVLRPGRISEAVEIGLPIPEARRAMLRLFTADMPLAGDLDFDELVARTGGASGADLHGLCTSAGRNAFLREMIEKDDEHIVCMADFERALQDLFPEEQWNEGNRKIGF